MPSPAKPHSVMGASRIRLGPNWSSMPFDTHEELVELAVAFLPTIPEDRFPYFAEHGRQHLLPPDPEEKSEFEFGLDLILDGLERLRDDG